MQLPSAFLASLKEANGFHQEAFEHVHASAEAVTSIRLNPAKSFNPFPEISTPIPWTMQGFYLSQRPSFTFDPLFHAGCYYVQEPSSMFLEQVLKQSVDLSKPIRALDLCAAPGGKSTHLQSLLSAESLLVANEVIKSRAGILKDNIIKWGSANVVVTQNDPQDFSKLENYFDVIVVDAPCSGSGLFRRDADAIQEWSENNVTHCSLRQQRILADVWPALKENGVLIYATCSFSIAENEANVKWLKNNFNATSIELNVPTQWNIIASDSGYRFWPHLLKGEGFFIAAFRKQDGREVSPKKMKRNIEKASKHEMNSIANWIQTEQLSFIKNNQTVYAWPEIFVDELSILLQQLKIIYSGVLAGELLRDKFIPDHALAMSLLVSKNVKKVSLHKEQAIAYLQRKNFSCNTNEKGWVLASYQEKHLGWMNILPNRINNYYPKELRILKEREGN